MNTTNKILMCFLGIILLLIIVFTVIQIYPFEVIQINGEFKTLTPIVKQGELLKYQVNATKIMPLVGIKKCSFEDGIIYFLPNIDSRLKLGEHNDTIGVTVPATLPEGTYRYHCIVDYDITFFRTITIEFYTTPFIVTK